MLMNDFWIREMCEKGMIDPYEEDKVSKDVISYGIDSYGYDFRLSADEVKIFNNLDGRIVDPKRFDERLLLSPEIYVESNSPYQHYFLLPPLSYALGKSVEYFRIPRAVRVICLTKSTYARCGVMVNVTPLEPEWEGVLTVEIANLSQSYVRIYLNEGIASLGFLLGGYAEDKDKELNVFYQQCCEKSYKDHKGKYDKQLRLTYAKVDREEREG